MTRLGSIRQGGTPVKTSLTGEQTGGTWDDPHKGCKAEIKEVTGGSLEPHNGENEGKEMQGMTHLLKIPEQFPSHLYLNVYCLW